jgi:hypothetical protein
MTAGAPFTDRPDTDRQALADLVSGVASVVASLGLVDDVAVRDQLERPLRTALSLAYDALVVNSPSLPAVAASLREAASTASGSPLDGRVELLSALADQLVSG